MIPAAVGRQGMVQDHPRFVCRGCSAEALRCVDSDWNIPAVKNEKKTKTTHLFVHDKNPIGMRAAMTAPSCLAHIGTAHKSTPSGSRCYYYYYHMISIEPI